MPLDDMLPDDLKRMLDDTSLDDLRDPADVERDKINCELQDDLTHAYRLVAGSKEGGMVLRHIMRLTGYQAPLCMPGIQGVDVNGSLMNMAKRDLWLEIRSRLDQQSLVKVENHVEVKSDG